MANDNLALSRNWASAIENARNWYANIQELLAAGDAQAIQESVLSVLVRDSWHQVGAVGEAEEFEVLLSTGGPALRIWGRLDRWDEPTDCELQMQDWGLPWTRWHCSDDEYRENLRRFASFFCFAAA